MLGTNLSTSAPAAPAAQDDLALVQAAQKDLSLFGDLYQRHVNQVYRYLLVRVGNVDDAQDLTSQTFLAAMQGLRSYRGQQPFPAWLLGIAHNKRADLYRGRKPDSGPHAANLEAAGELSDEAEPLDETLGRQLDIEQVTRKLAALSPDRAEALSLRLFGELEVAEIAQMMNKNEAAVRMLIFRGLRDLQAQLSVTREKK